MRTTAEYCQAGNKRRVRGKQDTIYLDEQPGMGHSKGFVGLWISLRWRAQDEGSPNVALHPVKSHLNGFWPVLDDPSLVMVTRPRLMKTHTGHCGIWPEEIYAGEDVDYSQPCAKRPSCIYGIHFQD